MASIKLKGNTSGEITIDVPAVAGTNTLTLPATTGNVLTDGAALPAIDGSALTGVVPDALSTATGSAPSYSARAWVNFNGTGTVAIRSSGNVSSITDHDVGMYTVNMTTAMPDANYAIAITGQADSGNDKGCTFIANETGANTVTTTSFPIRNGVENAYGVIDLPIVCATVFR